mgnify:CR=1 FL=1
MNKVILMGRLTRDPDIRYAQNENQMAIARYTLAVDRRMRRSQDGAGQDQQIVVRNVLLGIRQFEEGLVDAVQLFRIQLH